MATNKRFLLAVMNVPELVKQVDSALLCEAIVNFAIYPYDAQLQTSALQHCVAHINDRQSPANEYVRGALRLSKEIVVSIFAIPDYIVAMDDTSVLNAMLKHEITPDDARLKEYYQQLFTRCSRDQTLQQKLASQKTYLAKLNSQQLQALLFGSRPSSHSQWVFAMEHHRRFVMGQHDTLALNDEQSLSQFSTNWQGQTHNLIERAKAAGGHQGIVTLLQKHSYLLTHIFALKRKAFELKARGHKTNKAAQVADSCANKLLQVALQLVNDKFVDDEQAEIRFTQAFNSALKKAYPELKQHRGVKHILANIAIAAAALITGVGLIIWGVALLVNKGFFFRKTQSALLLDNVTAAAESLKLKC